MLDDPVDGCDHLRNVCRTERARDFDADDSRFRRNTVEIVMILEVRSRAEDQQAAARAAVPSGHEAGHVSAVPERVQVLEVRRACLE
jgi:hypothetical protein